MLDGVLRRSLQSRTEPRRQSTARRTEKWGGGCTSENKCGSGNACTESLLAYHQRMATYSPGATCWREVAMKMFVIPAHLENRTLAQTADKIISDTTAKIGNPCLPKLTERPVSHPSDVMLIVMLRIRTTIRRTG